MNQSTMNETATQAKPKTAGVPPKSPNYNNFPNCLMVIVILGNALVSVVAVAILLLGLDDAQPIREQANIHKQLGFFHDEIVNLRSELKSLRSGLKSLGSAMDAGDAWLSDDIYAVEHAFNESIVRLNKRINALPDMQRIRTQIEGINKSLGSGSRIVAVDGVDVSELWFDGYVDAEYPDGPAGVPKQGVPTLAPPLPPVN